MRTAARPLDALDRFALVLFRLRSVTPLPLMAIAVAWCWREQILPGPGGAAVDALLNALGIALAMGGSAVRLLAAGFEPTLRSQTRQMSARTLNTGGPYQLVRHPLYLGNALISLGLVLILHRVAGYALVVPAFALEYALIIRAEERLLHETYGEAWARWASEVPAFVPRRLRTDAFAGLAFDWRAAIRREVNPFVAWALAAALLLAWEWWAREALTEGREFLLQVAIGGLLGLLAANKLWKKVQPS